MSLVSGITTSCPDVQRGLVDALSPESTQDWKQFCAFTEQYSSAYATHDEAWKRFGVFSSNLRVAEQLQFEADSENAMVEFGVTKFSDWTSEEFRAWAAPGKPGIPDYPATYVRKPPSNFTVPASFDWRSKQGVIGAVRDQGACGNCWAFSATEEVESMYVMAGNDPVVLSVQEVTSCDKHDNWHCPDDDDCKNVDAGCNGGDPVFGILYICNKTHGLATEENYPFKSGKQGKTGQCLTKSQSPQTSVKCSGFSWGLPPCDKGNCKGMDEKLLMANIAAYGPAAISVDAASNAWQTYKKGIMPANKCKSGAAGKLDHAVQLVGYGSDGGQNYWTVRNSWAADWGEKGFIRLPFGDNSCGLADQPVFPNF